MRSAISIIKPRTLNMYIYLCVSIISHLVFHFSIQPTQTHTRNINVVDNFLMGCSGDANSTSSSLWRRGVCVCRTFEAAVYQCAKRTIRRITRGHMLNRNIKSKHLPTKCVYSNRTQKYKRTYVYLRNVV